MALTDIKVKKAKGGITPDGKETTKRYKMGDTRGLYLEVSPNGGKWWRLKYRFEGKERRLSLGVYPDVSLKDARERREEFRRQIANGIDPAEVRKEEKEIAADKNCFETIAREWHQKFSATWTDDHAARTLTRIQNDVFPWLGKRNIGEITAPDLLVVLRRVENRGALETAHRINQICGQVFRYAIATGRADRDISADLKGALPPTRVKHHSSITEPKAIGELLRAINSYSGSFITAIALKLSPLLFVRPGELRQAEWSEIDFENNEWRIPAEKMKMRELHIVPLSVQAVQLIKELQPLTGKGKYLFPSNRTATRPMSNNTINASLRRLGYTKEEMTAHGFRSMASTILNEQGWNRDAIERQLAHSERDGVRAAYNYAQYLPERKKMMQSWADYLDGLANGAQVISIGQK
nr:integrase arm-type DNA-binding domain-containing protein [uncultured Methylophaga sp.]